MDIPNIITYLGPYIGLMPALFLAFSKSLPTVFWVIVVCIVVQQLDGNLVYPNVIGKSLHLHPLTITQKTVGSDFENAKNKAGINPIYGPRYGIIFVIPANSPTNNAYGIPVIL